LFSNELQVVRQGPIICDGIPKNAKNQSEAGKSYFYVFLYFL
jgi:hypothetical protein